MEVGETRAVFVSPATNNSTVGEVEAHTMLT